MGKKLSDIGELKFIERVNDINEKKIDKISHKLEKGKRTSQFF